MNTSPKPDDFDGLSFLGANQATKPKDEVPIYEDLTELDRDDDFDTNTIDENDFSRDMNGLGSAFKGLQLGLTIEKEGDVGDGLVDPDMYKLMNQSM